MSYSDRTPRDRPKANNLALWAASILLALLTGCSAVQPVRGFSGWSAFEVHGAEHYAALDANVSGHAYDQAGEALPGVYIYIRAVPESGEPYQTTTAEDGSYSYSVPEGDYQIFAEYNPNDEPGGGVYLEPTDGVSITLTSSAEVNFQLPPS
jgi:Carboxypeptidase regulatory-like domain